MKLCSFTFEGHDGFGAVVDGGIVDLTRALSDRGVSTVRGVLAAGLLRELREWTDGRRPDVPLGSVDFLPVVPDPDKIICIGLNYSDHVAETGRTLTEKPALFARFAGSQVGHLRPMILPGVSQKFDYEGELAVVIGKTARHVASADALSYVGGYACYNDGSIRDWQQHTTQFLAGKTFAGTGAFGPWLVTSDEIPDPSVLTLETRLNGQVVQHASTGAMINNVAKLVEYCSTILPLLPGDVIVTGTPGGVGAKRTPPLWMRAGDTVEVEISMIGCLRNTIVEETRVDDGPRVDRV